MVKPSITAAHINPFIHACKETFRLMAGVVVTPEAPQLLAKNKKMYDITGIIGISGEAKGSINLCLNKSSTLNLVSKFVGAEITRMDAETADAVGELANIIAGHAKKGLSGLQIEISLPIIIMGHNHLTDRPKGQLSFLIPFTSSSGSFDLLVSLKN